VPGQQTGRSGPPDQFGRAAPGPPQARSEAPGLPPGVVIAGYGGAEIHFTDQLRVTWGGVDVRLPPERVLRSAMLAYQWGWMLTLAVHLGHEDEGYGGLVPASLMHFSIPFPRDCEDRLLYLRHMLGDNPIPPSVPTAVPAPGQGGAPPAAAPPPQVPCGGPDDAFERLPGGTSATGPGEPAVAPPRQPVPAEPSTAEPPVLWLETMSGDGLADDGAWIGLEPPSETLRLLRPANPADECP
jgi:hypothetical protein